MMTTTAALKPTKPGSVTLDQWENVAFLVKEPNRLGKEAFYIRIVIGDLPRWRLGPYSDEASARKDFGRIPEVLDKELSDALSNVSMEVDVRVQMED